MLFFATCLSAFDGQNEKVSFISQEEIYDTENQQLDFTVLNSSLSMPFYLAFRLYSKTIKERINAHFRLNSTISINQIETIICEEVKTSFIHSGTSLTLFAAFIGTNMLFSWGVDQVPYSWLSSSLYTFQAVTSFAISAPILTPWISYFTQRAFKFRNLTNSSTIKPETLEKLWFATSEQFSMNAEMARNLSVYFIMFINSYKHHLPLLTHNKESTEIIEILALEISEFLIYSTRLFAELSFDNELIEITLKNFVSSIKNLVPFDKQEQLLKAIEEEVEKIKFNKEDKEKIKTRLNILKQYWKSSQNRGDISNIAHLSGISVYYI